MLSTVAQIMTRRPIVVESGTSIVNTAKTMRDARIGSLLVKKGNQWVGIITETDIVRRAVANNRNLVEQTVDMIMTTPISTIEGNCMVHEARDLMSKLGVRHLAVTLAGEIVGVISVRDLLSFYEGYALSKERELSEPKVTKD
jgi:signal-transduction protein with cAMP-binding, CBS, and nucleotidyltransferase domain